jgi:hypothetical protein
MHVSNSQAPAVAVVHNDILPSTSAGANQLDRHGRDFCRIERRLCELCLVLSNLARRKTLVGSTKNNGLVKGLVALAFQCQTTQRCNLAIGYLSGFTLATPGISFPGANMH